MTFYIQVQDVDYDDYPVGRAKNIGPFDSKEEAEAYMEKSKRFIKVNTFGYEHFAEAGGKGFSNRSTIYVYPMDMLLTSTEDYDGRGY